MPAALRAFLRRLPVLVLLAAMMTAGAGVLAFFWAFRPCPVQLDAGTILTYRLRTELRETGLDGKPGQVLVDEQDIDCLSLNDQGDLALVARNSEGADRLHLIRLEPDGSAVPIDLDSTAREAEDAAHTIGFFDFNLLPLPLDASQSWRVELSYGYLPPGHRRVQGEVRRLKTGPNPHFELALDNVEWIESRPYEHFRSLEGLTCRYRYNAGLGVVDRARLHGRYGLEGRQTPRYVQLDVQLELLRSNQTRHQLARQDLILVQDGRPVQDPERTDADQERVLLQRLYDAAADLPRLQQLLLRRMRGDQTSLNSDDPLPADPAWFVQVASISPHRRAHAERAAEALRAEGWPARILPRGEHLIIIVGPYDQRDPATRDRLEDAIGERVLWVRLP